MMDYTVTEPRAGGVALSLDWKDAEILVRVLGLVNAGSLAKASPDLYSFVVDMTDQFGRNTESEAENFVSSVRGSQIFLERVERGSNG